jgi:hypothetical protein
MQDGLEVSPRIDSLRKREVVESCEQLERAVPAVVRDDRLRERLPNESPADVGVEDRPAVLALLGLVEEPCCELGLQLCSAAFACSAILPKAAGSLTARSARILRSSSMPAFRQPEMNWL